MSDDLDFTGVSTDELRAMYSTAARIANACMAEGKRRAAEVQATSCSHAEVNHFQETPEECAFDECRDCGKETATYPPGGNPHLAAPVAATPLHPVTEIGVYKHGGEFYRVRESRAGHLYAELIVGDGENRVASFEYVKGMIRKLYAEDKITMDEAKEFGKAFGACMVCGRTLTNETSIEAGIGPICAGRL